MHIIYPTSHFTLHDCTYNYVWWELISRQFWPLSTSQLITQIYLSHVIIAIIMIIIITIIIIITSETGITIYNYKSHRKLVNVKGLKKKKKNRLVCINLRPEYFPNIFVMNSRLDL